MLSAGERCIDAEGFCPLWDRGLPGKLLLGKEKSEWSGRNTLALVR